MRVTAGGSHDARGYAGILMLFVISGLLIAGVMLAPNLLLNLNARKRLLEERTGKEIIATLVKSIERTQTIPSATNWSAFMLPYAARDQTEIEQVLPGFASDSKITRVFLVDPGLAPGLFPYFQGVLGATNAQTNLFGSYGRVMLVSNTKRSLTLPVSNGSPSSNLFQALWSWAYDPSTGTPPGGFPGSWTGFGEYLHVQRLNLPNLFFRITLNHLAYGVGETSTATNLVSSQVTRYFLGGTRLVLAQTNGTLKQIHVVKRDASFDFSPASFPVPLGWWRFAETNGSVATNSGSLGASANGLHPNGVTLNVAGPRAPAFSGFSSNNTAAKFDGANDYVTATNNLMNNWTAFTIAGWINPSGASRINQDLFGQLEIAALGFTSANKVELWCENGSKKLHYTYPYSPGEWHHLVGVGDGAKMYLYVDGVEVASRGFATGSYGSNGNAFTIGAKTITSGNYFNGYIDEVLVYDFALNPSEIAQLYAGTLP